MLVVVQTVLQEILPEFFRNFWVRRMALDRRNYRQLVETTVAVAQKTGCSQIVGRIVEDLKDESEPYRRMVMETIDKVPSSLQPHQCCLCNYFLPIGLQHLSIWFCLSEAVSSHDHKSSRGCMAAAVVAQ